MLINNCYNSRIIRTYNCQIKVRQYFLHAYIIIMYDNTVPNRHILHLPIFLLALILGNLPNLTPTKFSSYAVAVHVSIQCA